MRKVILLASLVTAIAAAADAVAPAVLPSGLRPEGVAPAVRSAEAKKRRSRRPIRIVRFQPRNGRTFVDLAAEPSVQFTAPVDPATVTADTVSFRRISGGDVTYTLRAESGGRRLVFSPASPLEPGTDYELLVRAGVATADGRALRGVHRTIFYTDNRFSPYPVLRPDQFVDLDDRMVEPRASHSATLLPDGRVLLAGGATDATAFATTGELFDPLSREFRPVFTSLHHPRAAHAAVLRGTDVMLIGGYSADAGGVFAVRGTDVYTRAALRFLEGPPLVEARDYVAAVTLADGRVLVTGGLRHQAGGFAVYSQTAEILDAGGTFRLTKGSPIRRRAGHSLSLLPDGRVLVVGGISAGSGFPSTAEIFDPVTETFVETTHAPANHRSLHTATALPEGWIALADGGNPSVEIYDPVSERFFFGGGASFVNRTLATATLLPGEMILFAGGIESRGSQSLILQSMDLYIRSAGDVGRVFRVGAILSEPRAGHTATALANGDVLIAGGYPANPGGTSLDTATLLVLDPPAK